MKYSELFLESIQLLRKNIMRTGLTMLGIVIGITAVILIVSIGQGAVKFVTDELNTFGSDVFLIVPGSSAIATFSGGQKNLTVDDADAIRESTSLNNIEIVVPLTMTAEPVAANGVSKSILIRGVTHEASEILNPSILAGTFIRQEDDITSSRVAVLGIDVALDFFGEGTNPVGEIIRIDNKPFRVIGVSESTSTIIGGTLNNIIFVPTSVALNEIVGREAGLQQIGIKVKNPEIINSTIEEVELLLRDQHNLGEEDEDDFVVQSFKDILSTIQTITTLLTAGVAGVSGISLVVGGVGVMNIMLVTVTERTREIGLLKAIGAKQKDILAQFLIEAVVMTVIGGAIGITIGITGAFLITLVAPIPFVISIPAIIIAVGVSILVGVIFGLYPARRAAKLSPIDALRYE